MAGDHAQQRRLAGAVGVDRTDNAAGRQTDTEIIDQDPIIVGLVHVIQLNHDVAQSGARRNVDLEVLAHLLGFLAQQPLMADTRACPLAWRARGAM